MSLSDEIKNKLKNSGVPSSVVDDLASSSAMSQKINRFFAEKNSQFTIRGGKSRTPQVARL